MPQLGPAEAQAAYQHILAGGGERVIPALVRTYEQFMPPSTVDLQSVLYGVSLMTAIAANAYAYDPIATALCALSPSEYIIQCTLHAATLAHIAAHPELIQQPAATPTAAEVSAILAGIERQLQEPQQ